MKQLFVTLSIIFGLILRASAALTLNNGGFDNDPDLGGSDDTENAPSGWFTHYTVAQSWSDFRFGATGNGAWDHNGVTFGQNYLGPNFDPGPEDGYYYTSLGTYSGEFGVRISGFGYNRINSNPAGGFDVGLYYSRTFVGANGTDVASNSVLLGSIFVDISALTGSTPRSQAFTLSVNFGGSGIQPGDQVWLRLSDGPDNGDLNTLDEPTIDNLSLQIIPPATSYAETILADGPIAYWRFNDTPPTAINSGSLGAVANGTYLNGATSGAEAPRPPQFGGFEANNTALQLDGVDDFVQSMPRMLNTLTNVTMSGWIRRAGAQRNRTGLWGQDNLIEFGYIDNLTVQVWVDDFTTPVNISTPFPDLEWDYLALVVDGGALRMTVYTNGQTAGFAAIPQGTNYNSLMSTQFFRIGGDTFGNGVSFNGQIDEVAVFDKALSADKIASHYFSTVASPPRISRQPQGTNVFEGADVVLSVVAVGSPPLQYQWLYFGNELSGQTGPTLVISNATPNDSGSYSVRVSNNFGSLESDVVDVVVNETQPPIITQEPLSQNRYAGRTATFTVVATGGSRLRYQWQFNAADLTGQTNSTLTLNNISSANTGPYRVIVSNNVGSVTSVVATLTVITPAAGSYEAAVVGAGPLAYWRLGETSGTTAFDNWGGYDGTYMNVTLGVDGALINDPDKAAEFNGTSSAVTTPLSLNGLSNVTMTGWIRRGGTQAGRTGLWGQNDLIEFGYIDNDTLQLWVDNFQTPVNINPNPFPDGEWDFLAVVLNNGELAVYTNALLGGTASLGTGTYGATDFKFNIGGGGIFDAAGNFFLGRIDEVAVYDKALTRDQIASLFVLGSPRPPIIVRQPQSTNFFEGGTLRLCVEAFGAPPLSYKWTYFGNEVPGQTGACFVVQSATPNDSGTYQVEVTNPYGSVLSAEVTVDVMPARPPVITQDPPSATRYAGGSVTFTAAASGSEPLTFQWQHDGADVPGATSTTLTLNNLQASDGGGYRLIAANILGRATSAVATLTILTPPAGYASAVVSEAPIAYWRLGETSGPTAFDYVGGNHGTYNNVTLGVPGALPNDPDTAAGFDGTSSYVNTPLSLNNLPNVTLTGWIRRGGPQADRTGLFGQNDLVEFGYINNDTIQAWIDNFGEHVDVTPNPFPDLQWSFLTLVLNSGALSVYTNGQVAGTATLPTANYGSNNFRFNIGGGGIFDVAGNFFLGSIDEVAVFDRALSASVISGLYAAGQGVNRCPTANPLSVSTEQNTPVSFQLVGTDPDGDPLRYIVTQPPAHGVLTVQAQTGQATYTPAQAASTIAYVVPAGTFGNQDLSAAPQSLGMDFDVNSPIQILSLGVFDSGSDGLLAPLRVHVFNRETQLSVVNLLFTPADPGTLIEGSRFKPLPGPLALPVGFQGSIVVDYTTSPTEPNGNLGNGPGSWSTDSGGGVISFVGSGRHTLGGTGAGYPDIVDGGPANRFASGTFQFQPVSGFCGPDSFRYKVNDGECDSAEATVSIITVCTNQPPVCVARVVPEECGLTFGTDPNLYVLSLNDADACVILHGSGSSEPNGNPLQFLWIEGTNILGTAAVITNCFELGCHTITFMVNDGPNRCTTNITLCVITASEATEQCAELVEETNVDRRNKRPLIASLKAAAASFERGNFEAGMNQLEAFQLKVRAQIDRSHPAEAAALIACAQDILDAIGCAAVVAEEGVGRQPSP